MRIDNSGKALDSPRASMPFIRFPRMVCATHSLWHTGQADCSAQEMSGKNWGRVSWRQCALSFNSIVFQCWFPTLEVDLTRLRDRANPIWPECCSERRFPASAAPATFSFLSTGGLCLNIDQTSIHLQSTPNCRSFQLHVLCFVQYASLPV
jgi:hypothetical protein